MYKNTYGKVAKTIDKPHIYDKLLLWRYDFIAAGGVWELTHIIMALMPGVSGGFITLTLFIVALMLVFLLSMIITYPAIWLFRYV